MTPTEQKQLIDAIARAAFGWPDDGTRRTYAPGELPGMVARLRAKAELYVAQRDQPAPTETETETGPQGAHETRRKCDNCGTQYDPNDCPVCGSEDTNEVVRRS